MYQNYIMYVQCIQCKENGQWEELSNSTCPNEHKKCNGNIRIVPASTNNWASDLNWATDINTTITYTCDMDDTGLVVTSTCNPNGKWSAPMPSACPLMYQCCASDPFYDDNLVTRTWNNSHNLHTKVFYECALARIPNHEATIESQCQANGTWSELNPTIESVCYITECIEPGLIDDLYLNGDRLNDVATLAISDIQYGNLCK